MKKLSIEELKGMNKKQLYDYCRANKIKGYSNQNKTYINNLILNSYKSEKQPAKKPKTSLGSLINEYGNQRNQRRDYKTTYSLEEAAQKITQSKLKKSTRKLNFYLYGTSIRSDGIGDVDYIIVTTSKKNAISRIMDVDVKGYSYGWIYKRISTFSFVNMFPKYYKKIKGFNPWNTPEILYMVETDKMVNHIISSRTTPKIVKMWNKSGLIKKVSAINQVKKVKVKKPTFKEIKKIKNELAKNRDSHYGDIRYKEYTISPDIKESGTISGWYLDRRPNVRFHPGVGSSGFTTGSAEIKSYGMFKKIDDLVIKIIELERS